MRPNIVFDSATAAPIRFRLQPRGVGGWVLLGLARLIVYTLDTAAVVPLVLVISAVDRHAKLAHHVVQYWAWLNVKVCGSTVEVEGLEQLDPDTSYVFMANHRSNFDVLALVSGLWDFQLRWVAKEELARIPLFGWALRATGQIVVDRRDHAQAVASLAAAKARIRDGISVAIFPEGTRGTGKLQPFKKGGFVFAIETKTPIVPIAIVGTESILPRDAWTVRHGGCVRVLVHAPIPTADLSFADRDLLLAEVERAIASMLGETRETPARAAARNGHAPAAAAWAPPFTLSDVWSRFAGLLAGAWS